MLRFLRNLVVGCALIGGGAGWAFYQHLGSWSQTTPTIETAENRSVIQFTQGMGLAQLASLLHHQGIIDNERSFRLYVRLISRNYHQFQAGTYQFEGPLSPLAVIEKITKGDIYQPIFLSITVPEGFTLQLLLNRLEAHGLGTVASLKALAKNPTFLRRLQIGAPSLEGFIYPATYNFFRETSAEEALTVMVKNFWKNLPPHYERDVAAKGLTLTQAVTFASLIELETQADEERPLVSEVIWRRLKDKVPLGIDAAIIYGIQGYDGDLKWKHLTDRANPYNTRIHLGLPPGPIGSPSRKSLEAVLTPANEGYYYYVLKAGTNRHQFSRTLADHNRAVKELVAALRAKRHDDQSPTRDTKSSQGGSKPSQLETKEKQQFENQHKPM